MGGLQTLQWVINHAQIMAPWQALISQTVKKKTPLQFLLLSSSCQIVSLRMWVWVRLNLRVCVCAYRRNLAEKKWYQQAASTWVRETERESEMPMKVRIVKCLSNSRYHADSCQWYHSLCGRLVLVRWGDRFFNCAVFPIFLLESVLRRRLLLFIFFGVCKRKRNLLTLIKDKNNEYTRKHFINTLASGPNKCKILKLFSYYFNI